MRQRVRQRDRGEPDRDRDAEGIEMQEAETLDSTAYLQANPRSPSLDTKTDTQAISGTRVYTRVRQALESNPFY